MIRRCVENSFLYIFLLFFFEDFRKTFNFGDLAWKVTVIGIEIFLFYLQNSKVRRNNFIFKYALKTFSNK